MSPELQTELLCHRPEWQALVCQWLRDEWPAYYGPGGPGQVEQDVARYAQAPALGRALGALVLSNGQPRGFMALKTEPLESYPQPGYWVGAAYVVPGLRRQGLGAALLNRLETEAVCLSTPVLWCATATADNLLLRQGWALHATVEHHGAPIRIYQRHLSTQSPVRG